MVTVEIGAVLRRLRAVAPPAALGLALAACGPAYVPPEPTEGDRAALAEATQTALEGKQTGESLNWSNPDSGHRGTVTPVRTFEKDGRPCRRYQQTVTIEGTTLSALGTACRRDDGQWVTTRYSGFDTVGRTRRYPYYGYHPYYYDPFFHDRYYHRHPFHRRYGFHGRLGMGFRHGF